LDSFSPRHFESSLSTLQEMGNEDEEEKNAKRLRHTSWGGGEFQKIKGLTRERLENPKHKFTKEKN
jgi:hypothetical protein